MKKTIAAFLITLGLLAGLPLAGAVISPSPVRAVDITSPICDPNGDGDHSDALDPVACGIKTPEGSRSQIVTIIQMIVQVLVLLVGAISVIMLVIGGIRYTVSGGDAAGVRSAKDTIIYALVGIIVAGAAQLLVTFVIGRIGT